MNKDLFKGMIVLMPLLLLVYSGCGNKKNDDLKQAKVEEAAGNIDAKKGNIDQAIADFNKAIMIDADFPEGYLSLALIYANVKGDYDQAILDYNKVLELDPQYKKIYSLRGLAYLMQNKYQEAFADLSHAILNNQDLEQNYNNRCYCLDKMGQYNMALTDCNNAIALNPNLANSYDTRAAVYLHQKDYADSWLDMARINDLGGKPSADTLEELKKESGKN